MPHDDTDRVAGDSVESRWTMAGLAPGAASVTAVRRAARVALQEWGADDLEWTVSQLLTEVAANAVLHAGTPFDVTLTYSGGTVRCEVTDASARPPRTRMYAADATTGRGLHLLEQLAAAWGVRQDGSGKTVWFEVTPAGSPGDGLDLDALLAGLSDEPGADELGAGRGTGRADRHPSGAHRASAGPRDSASRGRAPHGLLAA
jgi:anti-sigma regulatory factor (Ser/Thr protein kinase)